MIWNLNTIIHTVHLHSIRKMFTSYYVYINYNLLCSIYDNIMLKVVCGKNVWVCIKWWSKHPSTCGIIETRPKIWPLCVVTFKVAAVVRNLVKIFVSLFQKASSSHSTAVQGYNFGKPHSEIEKLIWIFFFRISSNFKEFWGQTAPSKSN
jgi:hypothetical protein